MELIQCSNDNFKGIVNRNKSIISTENLSYLYPHCHRMTHQIRLFKWSRDSRLSPDVAA